MRKLSIKHDGRKVAVLIDEYHNPILSEIAKPELSIEIRQTLSDFYATLMASESSRGFTLITGVTKFAKESIIPSLNYL